MSEGPRWTALPRSSSRWLLPTKPRQAAASSVRIYHPMTLKGLVGWQAARIAASLGAFAFLPGGASLPPGVAESLRSNDIEYRSLAVAKANHPARFLVLLLGDSFECTGVAKMAFDEQGREALSREAHSIEGARQVLKGAIRPPTVQSNTEGLLVLESVPWLPRLATWRLPAEVAFALGTYSKTQTSVPAKHDARAHGDFAPWNLLRTGDGWVVLDWEHATLCKPPFFDLWHYLLQAHSLLGRPSTKALVRGVQGGNNWVGTALSEYSRGCGRSPEEATVFFDDYISASTAQLAGGSPKERLALIARDRMQRHISTLRRK
jgi:Phosphotransferase enzyme family